MVVAVVDHGDFADIVDFDDIVVFGMDRGQVWVETLTILQHLCDTRFMMNDVKKRKFLISTMKILSHVKKTMSRSPFSQNLMRLWSRASTQWC